MRLEEIIFQVICQVSATEPTCSERRLLTCLASIFSDMRASPPPRQAVEAALMALIKTGTIYFCGKLRDFSHAPLALSITGVNLTHITLYFGIEKSRVVKSEFFSILAYASFITQLF
ncbi:unnamed protein product [Dibothriocephalus latus]|uniref:Uncharacterized protein n=1 Tax=Dibothriocephalus latus TaxID=60516 RepID=A0A3P7NKN4_DIBLA|nr:unnamed protein product [Dibothriocephalus latus]